jgi:hypothetical protein
MHHLDDIHPAAGAQDAIDSGHLVDDFCAVALGQAACGDQGLPIALMGSQVIEYFKGLYSGGADKPAGINDDDTRLFRVLSGLVARANQ